MAQRQVLYADATTNAAGESERGDCGEATGRGETGLVCKLQRGCNRRWSSYNSIFYFVAFAEVFAGCLLPPPPPACSLLLLPAPRTFPIGKRACSSRMNAFTYLQIALCSAPLYLYLLQLWQRQLYLYLSIVVVVVVVGRVACVHCREGGR